MKTQAPAENGVYIHADGTRRWYLDGLLHREDGPAVLYPDGGREWWRFGQLHRDRGPAIERADGSEEWWQGGKQRKRRLQPGG
jgi:hypothetical protein